MDFTEISLGKVACILGPRCSGKTTLANHIVQFVSEQCKNREQQLFDILIKCLPVAKELIGLIYNYSKKSFKQFSCDYNNVESRIAAHKLSVHGSHDPCIIIEGAGPISASNDYYLCDLITNSRSTNSLIILVMQYMRDIPLRFKPAIDFWFGPQCGLDSRGLAKFVYEYWNDENTLPIPACDHKKYNYFGVHRFAKCFFQIVDAPPGFLILGRSNS